MASLEASSPGMLKIRVSFFFSFLDSYCGSGNCSKQIMSQSIGMLFLHVG